MSESFFEDLNIARPDVDLGVGSGTQGDQTAAIIAGLEKVCLDRQPELLIIFGDTNTTLAGAIVASKLRIPTVHVEAGLRSFNRDMPEEINRIVADHVSDYLFAPTRTAMGHLEREGLAERSVFTGDIMADAVNQNVARAGDIAPLPAELAGKDYILVTLHRPYNVDDVARLTTIAEQLSALSQTVVFPVHPRTSKMIAEFSIRFGDNVQLIEPVGYLRFLTMQGNASKVVTDSGGIQKEAYMLAKPCITVRTETEWVETVDSGWNVLAGNHLDQLADTIRGFVPTGQPDPIFGVNVADTMTDTIAGILNAQ